MKTDVCVSITRPSLLRLGNLTAPAHETWANVNLQSDTQASCFPLWTPEGAAGLPLSNDVRCFLQSQTTQTLSCCKQAQSREQQRVQ